MNRRDPTPMQIAQRCREIHERRREKELAADTARASPCIRRYLNRHGSVSSAELAQQLGVPKHTLHRALQELIAADVIHTLGDSGLPLYAISGSVRDAEMGMPTADAIIARMRPIPPKPKRKNRRSGHVSPTLTVEPVDDKSDTEIDPKWVAIWRMLIMFIGGDKATAN